MILGCRDESAGLGAREEIAAETGNNDVHFRLLDLASLASVRRFADQFLRGKLSLAADLNETVTHANARTLH